MDTLDKSLINIPRRKEWGGLEFHHAPQKSTQCKSHELFVAGVFYLAFMDISCLWELKLWKKKLHIGKTMVIQFSQSFSMIAL